jgi:hypothetical protein
MPNAAQQLKMYGHLPGTPLKDVAKAAVDINDIAEFSDNRVCGHPDHVDPELANSTDPGNVAAMLDISVEEAKNIIESHKRMAQAETSGEATGSGSYPPGCNAGYPGVHSVAYYDDPAIWPSHLNRPLTDSEFQSIINARVWGPSGNPNGRPFTMEELKATWGGKKLNEVVNDFSEEAYRRMGVILYPVSTGPDGQHNIHVSYPNIPGSTIGIGWFPGSQPCPGDHVNLQIDKTYTSGFQGQLGLKIHELGHTLQLPHQFSNQGSHQEPMSYSFGNHLVVGYSTGEAVFQLPKSPSVSLLTRLYGGQPVGVPWKGKFNNPTDPPPPPPPPPGPAFSGSLHGEQISTGKFAIRGIVVAERAIVKGEEFIVAPSIDGTYQLIPKPVI